MHLLGNDQPTDERNWKSNRSFKLPINVDTTTASDSESESDAQSEASVESTGTNLPQSKSSVPCQQRVLEFDKTVEYYVDKTGNNVQRKWDTLPRLSRPQYKIRLRRLVDNTQSRPSWNHRGKPAKRLGQIRHVAPDVETKLTEEQSEEIQQRMRELKNLVANEPKQLDSWIELHQLMGRNMSKTNRLAVAEHQLHSLEMALEHHPGNEKLLQLYVATASATYPDSQVSASDSNYYELALILRF